MTTRRCVLIALAALASLATLAAPRPTDSGPTDLRATDLVCSDTRSVPTSPRLPSGTIHTAARLIPVSYSLPASAPVFSHVDVLIDSSLPLAAYQLEVAPAATRVTIVGVEGGDHPAFKPAPYYDPAAIQGERVIIGAFSLLPAAELPRGATRVARIHYMAELDADRAPDVAPGPSLFRITLQAASGPDGLPAAFPTDQFKARLEGDAK